MKKCICKKQNIIQWPLSTPVWRMRCIIYMTNCWHYIFWLLTQENANFYEPYLIHSIYFVNKCVQLPPFLNVFEGLRHTTSDKCQVDILWKGEVFTEYGSTSLNNKPRMQGCIHKMFFLASFLHYFYLLFFMKSVSYSVHLASVTIHLRKFRKMMGG